MQIILMFCRLYINQDNIPIDGAHRLSVYKHCKIDEIPYIITLTQTERGLFLLAVDRNNAHGLQLSQEDKRRLAMLFCGDLSEQEIIKRLSICERTYGAWTQTKRERLKEERDKKILDLWLQCYSTNEVDAQLNLGHGTSAKPM